LFSVWKDLLKKHDTVMVNFMESGNQDSSCTRASMIALKKAQGDTSSLTLSLAGNDDDDDDEEDDIDGADDEFGMETGGWCSFTNSLPIIHPCM
jgi:outer membrane scaffolding protein for murein synthesis (MipA/OmpV family)